jgi:PAS domain S-box-containing protein
MLGNHTNATRYGAHPSRLRDERVTPAKAEEILSDLAAVFLNDAAPAAGCLAVSDDGQSRTNGDEALPKPENMYRVLVEQIPALVFIAYLDQGVSEAYVSPQIESALGYSQEEWLEDPIRWYERVHPEDKQRWSADAAEMFLTGNPLKSAYRVIARDGRVVWFQCEVKMVRRPDGRPWFLHGVGFDISELKQTEAALQERTSALQNLSSRLLRMQDDEHRRIARELHDSLGQYLAALKMNLEMYRRSDADGADAIYSEIEQITDRCISETRTLSHLLHPPLLDELGFAAAAKWYVEGFAKRSGINVALELPPNLERLPEAAEVVLFRVLQEALTNIHRHSKSSEAEIHLGISAVEISLQVRDHGHGIPSELLERIQKTGGATGVGLSGMRERVSEMGGQLEIRSDRQGTLVRVTVPVSSETE